MVRADQRYEAGAWSEMRGKLESGGLEFPCKKQAESLSERIKYHGGAAGFPHFILMCSQI